MKSLITLSLLSAYILAFTSSCSLRGEDVLQKIEILKTKMDPFTHDETYTLETKKLRDKNPKSLMAHVTYITARSGSKVMVTEYTKLAKENKSPFYDYLLLRAQLSLLSYRDMATRNELVEKMEKLALENENIKDEALFDLSSGFYLLRDKKKKREYVEYLYNKRSNYRPYKALMSESLVANDEAQKILNFCEEELKGDEFDFSFCQGLEDLNEEHGKDVIERRLGLLELMVNKALKDKFKDKREHVWNALHSIGESGEGRAVALKNKFTEQVLKNEPTWIPRRSYRVYYGEDLKYKDFEFVLKVSKLHQEIDFAKRVKAFEDLLTLNLDKKKQAQVLSGLGHAYLNPANLDKEKAFKYFIQANEYESLSSYSTGMLIDLIIELNKDPDLGLMVVEDRLETSLEENAKNLDRDKNIDDFLKYSKGDLATFHLLRGRLFLKKNEESKARLSFLESFQLMESESAGYYLGLSYKEKNPLVAIDFLSHSIKNRNSDNPLDEELSKKRDALFKELYNKYFSKGLSRSELLETYNQGQTPSETGSKEHSFVGKPLVTDKLLDFKGGDYDWSKLQGKKVILSFWATWCTPCFQEMAVLNKLHKEGKIKNLKIVGICTDGLAQKKKVAKIVKDGGIEFDILLSDGSFKNKYLVTAIPSMFFLDESGKFIKQKTGYSPELENIILKLYK